MTASPNPVFKFNREVFTVKVENIADGASRFEIVDLFKTLIDEVRKCEEYAEGGRRVIELTFASNDAAKKALCMSGYTVSGIPLTVSVASPPDASRVTKQGKQPDNRRNLYVLGLPFDLTKVEFIEIFARYGTVSHAVILATVDNASRRRGFVVMSTHSEARAAMDALSRKEIKGHIIDVSWAVVQRSQGFLDGGDRTTVLASQPPSPTPSVFDFPAGSNPSSGQVSEASSPRPDRAPMSIFSSQANSVLVSNLPSILFSQLSDLYPLFCPYGDIRKIDILESGANDLNHGDISVAVEYATVAQALEARNALSGQKYSSIPVKVEFIQNPANPALKNDYYGPASAINKNMKAGLNPRAAPFVVPAGLPPDTILAPVHTLYAEQRIDQDRIAALPSGLIAVRPYPASPYATHGSLYTQLYVPVTETARPSSAPSP
ncbi:RNA-binding domain-containing protein [Wolfiporia cocos MD-104 SS10]|uniref:RNA-binding domain-containing protein n=1 Tax=Wolfiporia cocos (strain MD-104) TaxID=742152 RepID=A0A2H3IZJ4_WOLCO|nr:RNA-binding domain-containing protein [Wolfiporia cocos MD-104 SS10]